VVIVIVLVGSKLTKNFSIVMCMWRRAKQQKSVHTTVANYSKKDKIFKNKAINFILSVVFNKSYSTI